MLQYLKVEKFRSINFQELELGPLNVLIGPNGSGKSNLLDAFCLLTEAAYGRLSEAVAARGGIDDVVFKGNPDDLFFELRFGSEGPFYEERLPVTYKLKLKKVGANPRVWFEQVSKGPDSFHQNPLYLMHRDRDGCMFRSIKTGMGEEIEEGKAIESDSELAIYQVKDQDKYPTPYKLLRQMQEWTLYGDFNVGPNAPIRQPSLIRSAFRAASDGSNLISVLFSIQQEHPATWKEIEELLETTYPEFHSITFTPGGGDGKLLLRWWERPYEKAGGFSANLLSDGTLKLLCLLAVLKSPDPPPLICIDEPELGLHPDWVKLVAELLQSASTKTQLIVATHSPQLVSKLTPDQVLVAEKENGATTFRPLARERLGAWLKEFSLADLWLTGHLGGRP
jgi:predicted ATPase